MRTLILIAAALAVFACDSNVRQVSNSNSTSNAGPAAPPASNERRQTAIAHSSENQTPDPAANSNTGGPMSKWSQSGDPIDTTELDAAVMAAEKDLASKPAAPGAKKALADAYLKRAVALTEARQYAAALGDYRRTLKHDPANEEAKTWVDQITKIYASINRSSPKEGEEPPPLPFKKS